MDSQRLEEASAEESKRGRKGRMERILGKAGRLGGKRKISWGEGWATADPPADRGSPFSSITGGLGAGCSMEDAWGRYEVTPRGGAGRENPFP